MLGGNGDEDIFFFFNLDGWISNSKAIFCVCILELNINAKTCSFTVKNSKAFPYVKKKRIYYQGEEKNGTSLKEEFLCLGVLFCGKYQVIQLLKESLYQSNIGKAS